MHGPLTLYLYSKIESVIIVTKKKVAIGDQSREIVTRDNGECFREEMIKRCRGSLKLS